MRRVLFICFFMIFCLNLSAKTFDSMPYENRDEITESFLKEPDKNQKIKIIDSYINTKDDFTSFISSLGNEINKSPQYKENFIYLVEYYVNKFNNINSQKNSIDNKNIFATLYETTITKADDVEEFIMLLKKNKDLSNLEINIFGRNSFKFIPSLIDANNFSEMEKLLIIVKENKFYRNLVIQQFESYVGTLINNIERESFNKKRIDLSDFVKSKEEIIFTTLKTINKYGITISFETNGDIRDCNTVFKKPNLYSELPSDIQEIVLDYCKIDKNNKSKIDEQIDWYKPGYNFKSIKGYFEFIAYSEYNWIFAILVILYIFIESRRIIFIRLYNKEKDKLISSTRDFFYKNKIEKNEILPVKLITEKYKLYDNLIDNYDKLYIKSLKLGLYSSVNNENLLNLKNEINSLEKEIENLKEELIGLEQKFATAELQNLINIKITIEKLREITTFDNIINNITKIDSEINELLENYMVGKINDSRIEEIQILIQKIEEEVKESNVYLEEYNRLIALINPYDILGVDKKDDITVIKKKWKELCLKYHSDKNIDKPKYIKDIFDEIIKIINNSWDIISKQNKKEM